MAVLMHYNDTGIGVEFQLSDRILIIFLAHRVFITPSKDVFSSDRDDMTNKKAILLKCACLILSIAFKNGENSKVVSLSYYAKCLSTT